jgi:serine/threonine protein kinase
MNENNIELVHKLDDMPKKPFFHILPHQAYDNNELKYAADLLEEMLKWVPTERISCEKALNHKFFKMANIQPHSKPSRSCTKKNQ